MIPESLNNMLKGATTTIKALTDAASSPLRSASPNPSAECNTAPFTSVALTPSGSLHKAPSDAVLAELRAMGRPTAGASVHLATVADEERQRDMLSQRRSFFCRTSSSAYSAVQDEGDLQWCQLDNTLYTDPTDPR